MKLGAFAGHLFVFANRRKDRGRAEVRLLTLSESKSAAIPVGQLLRPKWAKPEGAHYSFAQ